MQSLACASRSGGAWAGLKKNTQREKNKHPRGLLSVALLLSSPLVAPI